MAGARPVIVEDYYGGTCLLPSQRQSVRHRFLSSNPIPRNDLLLELWFAGVRLDGRGLFLENYLPESVRFARKGTRTVARLDRNTIAWAAAVEKEEAIRRKKWNEVRRWGSRLPGGFV